MLKAIKNFIGTVISILILLMFIGLFFYTIYHDCVSEPKRLEKKFRNIGKEEKEDLENDHDEGYFRHPE